MFLGPWSEMHRLNLGWFIAEWNKFYAEWQSTLQAITGALTGEIERVEAAMTDLYAARDAAAASASSANSSALNASASSLAAMDARDAAVSAKNTAQSAASSATESETAAGNSATLASNKATQAGNSATAAAQSAGAAQQSETDAATEALKSEGYAVGKQNGTDVASGSPYYQNNSKYYAESISTNALKSEGFAVGEQNGVPVTSGSPYYQNNAKYFKDYNAPIDLSNNYTLNEAVFTVIGKSIIRVGAFIFYSFRLRALTTTPSSQVWANLPIGGNTGIDGSPWVRMPQMCITYETNIAASDNAVCAIGDKILRIKNVQENHYYEVSGFFKHNLT